MNDAFLPRATFGLSSSRWLAALAVSAATCVTVQAQEASSDAVDDQAQASPKVFAIPAEADSYDALMAFVEDVDGREPTGDSEDEIVAHRRRVAHTVVAVGERGRQLELTDEQAMQMAFFQLQGLRILGQLDEPGIDEKLADAIDVVRRDQRPDVAAIGMKFFVESGFSHWNDWGPAERQALIQQIVQYVEARKPDADNLQLVTAVVDFLGDGDGGELAKSMLGELLPHFRNNSNPELQTSVELLEGINRRLNLPGKKIELSGSLVDGTPLDWASYRGKVVLVDFWAIGCGPCRAEIPNVLRMYDAYHEKGFDVLGISLDSQAEQIETFLEREGIPWATIFTADDSVRGWNWKQPMAVKYGVTGIPRAILVDRDGTVVNMNARGPVLVRELRRLLGEPLAKAPSFDQPAIHQVAKPVVEQ